MKNIPVKYHSQVRKLIKKYPELDPSSKQFDIRLHDYLQKKYKHLIKKEL